MTLSKTLILAVPALALALGACGKKEQPAYQAEQSDIIVDEQSEEAVPVNLPTTPMTNVPVGQAAPATAPEEKSGHEAAGKK